MMHEQENILLLLLLNNNNNNHKENIKTGITSRYAYHIIRAWPKIGNFGVDADFGIREYENSDILYIGQYFIYNIFLMWSSNTCDKET